MTAKQRLLDAWIQDGYSDKFEIIGEYTRKANPIEIRCKLCGGTFTRIPESIYKQHTNLRCSNCWIHRDDETIAQRDYQLVHHLADAYESGESVAKIAKAYNLDERVVSRLIKESGVVVNCNKAEYNKNSNRSRFKTNDKRIRKEWRDLNNELIQWRKAIEAIRCEALRNTKTFGNLDDWLNGQYSWHKRTLVEYEPKVSTCKHCGKQWLFWPSHEKYGRRNPSPYCSSKCLSRYYKTGTINDRLRRFGRANEYRDVIPLDEVIERDNGICYICGCKTDKADSYTDANGYFVCGDTYPTRDHVIPVAKGGTHTWDNVRLACHKCNSIKNDRLLEECASELG